MSLTVAMPNPATDGIRRFTVEVVEHKPNKGRPWASAFLVRDRCGFLPDIKYPVQEREHGKRPLTEAEVAARTAAEEHRRNLNKCEDNGGHNFVGADSACTQCGVQP